MDHPFSLNLADSRHSRNGTAVPIVQKYLCQPRESGTTVPEGESLGVFSEAGIAGEDDGLGASFDFEFGEDAGDMIAHGFLA